jgi:Tol biopolymer transport system component
VLRSGRWLVALALAVAAIVVGGPAGAQNVGPSDAAILAVAGRQVAWLNLEAPRPRPVTNVPAPAGAVDVGARPGFPRAVVSVASAFGGSGGQRGADLMLLDLTSGALSPLENRAEARESFLSPTWWPDGNDVLFQRADLLGQTVGAPGQEVPRYPSRIEVVRANGEDRAVLVEDGREPSPAPDGSRIVFARTTRVGAAILSAPNGGGPEQVLVPMGRFADVAYPRFSPSGDQIAFVAPQSGLNGGVPARASSLFLEEMLRLGPAVAAAHGIPWDPWIMNADGSNLHRVAVVGGDEPSVTWSPDGDYLFVYSGIGSFVVDATTGDTTPLSFVTGYGPTAWLPIQS